MKAVKILAIAASLTIVLPMVAPTLSVPGSQCQFLQYKFYSNPAALFTALVNNQIDLMGWPLSQSQYASIAGRKDLQVAPVYELSDYEIAFNNNFTNPTHTSLDRAPMNYTEFRQAVACLVDKDGLLAGPVVGGFGERKDTPIPRPILDNWVDLNSASPTCVSKYDANGALINNYPWEYNETKALEILWKNSWYSHATYPTFANLLMAYASGLPVGSVVYPPSHPRAGLSIDPLTIYIRSDDAPMVAAGNALVAELTRIGTSTNVILGNSVTVYVNVYVNRAYDIATIRWTDDRIPLWFYSRYTPIGIYPDGSTHGGPNVYMIDDGNLTYHAMREYPYDTVDSVANFSYAIQEAKMCQYIIVQNAMFVTLYTPVTYIAYRSGPLGVIDFRGYGLTAYLEYLWMNMKVSPYSSPMTIRYGTPYPPFEINPIFSPRSVFPWDYEVIDSMFDTPIMVNPYNPTKPGKSPTGSDQPWLAYDWKYELSNFTGWTNNLPQGGNTQDPYGSTPNYNYTNCANVTFWFKNDTWQDGVPFTVDDYNYTLNLDYTYHDSWAWSEMQLIVNFVKINPWTCSIYFSVPSFWVFYNVLVDIVPKHIYENIAIPSSAAGGGSTTGHHGEWPGKDSVSSEILPNPYFTYSQLTGAGGEQYTWVGTSIWQYVPGTYISGAGGSAVFSANPNFWQSIVYGDIDFKYTWNSGQPPQGGSYAIGLSDLFMLVQAWGTTGNPPIPHKLGGWGVWESGCDLGLPACVIGLGDLVALARTYGKHWGDP
jgi:hypothetical protein